MVPVLDRYRPAALAVLAVLVAVAVLPGAVSGSAPPEQAAFDAGAVPDDDFGDDEDPVSVPSTAPSDDDADASTVVPAPAPDTFTQPDRSFSPSDDSFSSPPPSSSSDSPSSSDSSSTAPAPFIPSPDSGSASDDADPEPLRIVGSAYASTTAATPLPDDIPEGSLPVGTRVGQTDKASYIRLAGDETTLVLAEVADGRRGSDFEATPVAACRITDAGWESSTEAMAFSEAPEHDPEECVPVTRDQDGVWSVDLGGFGDPADPAGFALVPSEDAPIDFQVTFAARAVS